MKPSLASTPLAFLALRTCPFTYSNYVCNACTWNVWMDVFCSCNDLNSRKCIFLRKNGLKPQVWILDVGANSLNIKKRGIRGQTKEEKYKGHIFYPQIGEPRPSNSCGCLWNVEDANALISVYQKQTLGDG